jgi:hypothetical protein
MEQISQTESFFKKTEAQKKSDVMREYLEGKDLIIPENICRLFVCSCEET